MDIEKIQRINKLAKELYDRHMAEDMIEAAKMAENFIEKKQDSMPKYEEEHKDFLNEINLNVRRLTAKIGEQADAINKLKEELERVNKEIHTIKTARPSNVVLEKSYSQPQTTLKVSENVSSESSPREPHAKVGRYNPEDVSVEKMFYSGPK